MVTESLYVVRNANKLLGSAVSQSVLLQGQITSAPLNKQPGSFLMATVCSFIMIHW